MPASPLANFTPAAVIFDMDGTLLDTETSYKLAMADACRSLGYELDDETHRKTVGVPGDLADKILLEAFGADFHLPSFYEVFRKVAAKSFEEHLPVKPGAVELLDTLDEHGIPAAIATSTGRQNADKHLDAAGVRKRFAVIVTRNDVDNGKPHPEPFLKAAELLGVDPRACLALEDSYNGVKSAHAAGMTTVMIPDLLLATEEIERLCAAVLPSLHDLLEMLELRASA